MQIQISPELHKELKRVKARNKKLAQKIEKQLTIFEQNPRHSSLRIHKLTGKLDNLWSLSIDRNYRLLYIFDKEGVYFFDLGTHDQVYRR